MSEIADPDIMAPVEDSWRDSVRRCISTRPCRPSCVPDQLRAVQTSDGEIPAQLAVICTTKEPNTAIGVAAGPQGRSTGGFIVDERMSTSAPGVFARGDCTKMPNSLTGVPLQGLTSSHASGRQREIN